jgi:hypothetical protein
MPFAKAPTKVVAVFNKEEKPFKTWAWKNGKLRINAQTLRDNSLLNGFLVYK